MRIQAVDNGISIIKQAIKEKRTVLDIAENLGFNKYYVSGVCYDIKRRNYKGVEVDEFQKLWKIYKKEQRGGRKIKNKFDKVRQETIATNQTSTEVNDDSMFINYSANSDNYPIGHIKTLEELLERCSVDEEVWSVKDYVVNKWDVTSFRTGKAKTIENFQVKARLEKNIELEKTIDLVEMFKNNISNYKPPIFKSNSNNTNFKKTNNLLEICLFDTHFNKLVYNDETNDKYDIEIAEKRFLSTVSEFIERAKVFGFDRILFPVGNDFFNSDGMSKATTAGTPQDDNLLWHEAFRRGTELIKDAIYLMKATGVKVDVLMIPGNHDYMSNFFLGEYLNAWFKEDDLVSINNSANPRKYYSYGEILLGFTHGNEEKRDVLPMLMANEKELWYKSRYREWHLGHFHTKRNYKYSVLSKDMVVDERDGIIIRHLSSLSGTDSWTNKKGYTMSNKAGDGFIWSGNEGLLAHININV